MSSRAYDEALAITSDYLGPAAARFLDRQITFHLKKEPQKLVLSDIPKLAEWIKVSISILTEDDRIVHEFTERIMKLAPKKK